MRAKFILLQVALVFAVLASFQCKSMKPKGMLQEKNPIAVDRRLAVTQQEENSAQGQEGRVEVLLPGTVDMEDPMTQAWALYLLHEQQAQLLPEVELGLTGRGLAWQSLRQAAAGFKQVVQRQNLEFINKSFREGSDASYVTRKGFTELFAEEGFIKAVGDAFLTKGGSKFEIEAARNALKDPQKFWLHLKEVTKKDAKTIAEGVPGQWVKQLANFGADESKAVADVLFKDKSQLRKMLSEVWQGLKQIESSGDREKIFAELWPKLQGHFKTGFTKEQFINFSENVVQAWLKSKVGSAALTMLIATGEAAAISLKKSGGEIPAGESKFVSKRQLSTLETEEQVFVRSGEWTKKASPSPDIIYLRSRHMLDQTFTGFREADFWDPKAVRTLASAAQAETPPYRVWVDLSDRQQMLAQYQRLVWNTRKAEGEVKSLKENPLDDIEARSLDELEEILLDPNLMKQARGLEEVD